MFYAMILFNLFGLALCKQLFALLKERYICLQINCNIPLNNLNMHRVN